MASRTALFLALLIAASQAAPQGQVQVTATQQTDSSPSPDTSSSGSDVSSSGSQSGSGTSSNTGSSTGSRPSNIVFPNFSNLLPSFNFTGGSTSNSGQNPIAAIISVIPNAINTERERFGNAVQQLVSEQTNAATDSIGAAAQTGGKFVSNGVKVIASWPTFLGNLLG